MGEPTWVSSLWGQLPTAIKTAGGLVTAGAAAITALVALGVLGDSGPPVEPVAAATTAPPETESTTSSTTSTTSSTTSTTSSTTSTTSSTTSTTSTTTTTATIPPTTTVAPAPATAAVTVAPQPVVTTVAPQDPPPAQPPRVSVQLAHQLFCNLQPITVGIGDVTAFPSSNPYTVVGVAAGAQLYTMTGFANCGVQGTCTIEGAGLIDVRAGNVYLITLDFPNAFGVCAGHLS